MVRCSNAKTSFILSILCSILSYLHGTPDSKQTKFITRIYKDKWDFSNFGYSTISICTYISIIIGSTFKHHHPIREKFTMSKSNCKCATYSICFLVEVRRCISMFSTKMLNHLRLRHLQVCVPYYTISLPFESSTQRAKIVGKQCICVVN